MSEDGIRFYLDWGISPGEEVTQAEAVEDGDYSRAQFDEAGQPRWAELHKDGTLFHIDYWGTDSAAIKADHMRRHPGLPFGVQIVVERAGEYRWDVSFRHNGQGEQVSRIFILHDGNGLPLLDIAIDEHGRLRKVEKQSYHPTGKLQFVFRYDTDGKILDIFDNDEGDNLRPEEALGQVATPDFYREGFSLPAGVSGDLLPPYSVD
jgi:hypothetical protein